MERKIYFDGKSPKLGPESSLQNFADIVWSQRTLYARGDRTKNNTGMYLRYCQTVRQVRQLIGAHQDPQTAIAALNGLIEACNHDDSPDGHENANLLFLAFDSLADASGDAIGLDPALPVYFAQVTNLDPEQDPPKDQTRGYTRLKLVERIRQVRQQRRAC